MTDKTQALARIADAIRDYCATEHHFGFDPANPVIRLHEPTFSADEIIAATEVMLSTYVTMGAKVRAFEHAYKTMFGHAHGVMNNSGSSANLLAVAALVNPATPDHLRPGDEVIVPALSWSTTVAPLMQTGLVPVITDIDPVTLNLDPTAIEAAIGPKTRAIKLVHVYGNPCDMAAIMDICRRHNLILIEDCCEALGASYDGRPVGRFGRAGTFSFYFSHHITTLEGGITVTDDTDLAELMRILRAHGWVREVEDRERWLKQYPEIDPKFLFVNVGFNLRPTELSGAIGLVQLPKLADFVKARRANTDAWRVDLDRWSRYFLFQEETPNAYSSRFGFPITVRDDAPFTVREIMAHLNRANIETRPIIAGNLAVQPVMKLFPHRVSGDLQHSARVMRGGFTFGNHQDIGPEARAYVNAAIASFMAERGLN